MSHSNGDPGHGHSPAAWTAVIIMLIAVALGTVALFIDQWVLFWVAAGLLVVGALVGWIMGKAGYGANGPKSSSKAH
ncbi:HGxxPAAW family protein [Microbacterium sp. JZ31]|uniref:HGxxPAAW family protein n=1 Tax=Microbacterium sp. JZ31 TaxID=1906274 RepID=UPI0019320BEA|nr:HGxxPAAW family protein [Microbacterium sp. JZ31]